MTVDVAGVAALVIGARVLETALSTGASVPPADASGWATGPAPVAGATESVTGVDAAALGAAALWPGALESVELTLVDEFAAEVPVLVTGARALVAVDTTELTAPALGAATVSASDVEGFASVEVAVGAGWLAGWDPASALDAGAAGAGG